MSDVYDREISLHYAAYRPPIHDMIIEQYLAQLPQFSFGLDIGCGAGASSHAIAPICQHVVGIDPSEAMIDQAKAADNIRYIVGTGNSTSLPDSRVDLVTFAGSLPYAKSSALIEELRRVCRPNARVVVYDFEVQYQAWLRLLEVEVEPRSSNYDHGINFDDCGEFSAIECKKERLLLPVEATQLAHLLCSSQKRYVALQQRFGIENGFELLVEAIESLCAQRGSSLSLEIDCYYSAYHIKVD
ncbi:class I SAM-dependent methyltransferase [Vibrio sp. LaRot3]|uniref:class I SAM-dependent methyltransferase n=1 Tax=Vibrio sp. LaRot3 TaxID=2998829 RepID=UPI0022CE14CA|nr:class I SAM-dependent methyltransferase [Vibrio sp. LaRot3]MDA0149865.1 class I SAM-dependent methyltransferase [Vibrio sp. LaRot3]